MLDLKKERHLPNQLAAAMYARVNQRHIQDKLTAAQLLVLNEDLKALTDLFGACERIKTLPSPLLTASL